MWRCGSGEALTCGSVEMRKRGSVEVWKRGSVEVWKSVEKCGSVEAWKCGPRKQKPGKVTANAKTGTRHRFGMCPRMTLFPGLHFSASWPMAHAVVPFARSFHARTSIYLCNVRVCQRTSQSEGCEQTGLDMCMAPWPTSIKRTATCASTRGRRECGTLSCWVGAGALPDAEQGLTVLGVPFGAATFVRTQLRVSRAGHDQLLQRLPELDDLQASWLLLLFCCSPRCDYLLRMLPPSVTAEYAGTHDSAVLSTFADLFGVHGLPDRARRILFFPASRLFPQRLCPFLGGGPWAKRLHWLRDRTLHTRRPAGVGTRPP